jgi:hypothetical protein
VAKPEDDWDDTDLEEWESREEERALSPAGIAEQNKLLLRQYRRFRRAADAVTTAWQEHQEVAAVALIGSLAVAPSKEVPRFSPYRRARIALWHECKDVDLAVCLTDLSNLNGLRKAKDRALRQLFEETEIGVASHQLDAFILDPGTNRYLGRLCRYNRCPKGKRECLVPGCGAAKFLQQHEEFQWRPESLAEDRIVRLFDRSSGRLARAADLPLPEDEDAEGP